MDQLALTKPITKWNGRADNSERIPQLIAEAFRVLTNGRRGAGHLEIPLDVLQQDFGVEDSKLEVKGPERETQLQSPGPEIQRAAQLLRDAQRPLIFAGGGVIAAEAWLELVELA